jgi:ankyrin repeat protein
MEQFELNDQLMKAIKKNDLEAVTFYLSNGANIHFLNDEPVKWAVFQNNIPMIKLLCQAGANVLSKDVMGKTVIELAKRHNNKELNDYLKNRIRHDKIGSIKD